MSDTSTIWRVQSFLSDPDSALLTTRIHDLRESFRDVIRFRPLTCMAMVVLPGSLHALWRLQGRDCPNTRLSRLLAGFARRCGAKPRWLCPLIAPVFEDQLDWHRGDILTLPVQWGLAPCAREWPYSSARRPLRA